MPKRELLDRNAHEKNREYSLSDLELGHSNIKTFTSVAQTDPH